ncbi:hypothetical protein QZM42_33245 [Burkholderia vietnamiensis]|uniref:hypothetical protein n=1 Tax=Burkholderia vietnamiensis TaxID=60552 RepID=UPI00158E4519|nr:hypothetical protein [Burkholderia vietnamiensis]MDN7413395.1 hypothetical protein [Burkholderia vietnamiensis]
MHIERFLRVSRAYLLAMPAIAPRRECDGQGQLWRNAAIHTGREVQRDTSVAALWTTSNRNVGGTSWPA